MRFVTVRELRAKSAQVLRDLPAEGEVVVTSNGHPVAVLAPVDEAGLEETLRAFRRARAVDAVAALQRRSVESGRDRLSVEEIDAEIREVRRARTR
ncbi:MAG: type II toxin-antitoxin system prevent-host-death family antitoxin [Proteobacteria bacterium]|nr:type II toxin-antitoxin system prevent-host-death family antitoxin [Pseudomonadota bacterium]